MAQVIGIISQKGGVGKSTLSRLLAVEYARNEFTVKIADMDLSQGTVTEWNRLRMSKENEPLVHVEQFNSVAEALKQRNNYDLVIFDGAPHATRMSLDIALQSDFIVLPTGVTLDDLLPEGLTWSIQMVSGKPSLPVTQDPPCAITGANMWQYVVTRLIVGWIGGSLIEMRFQRNLVIAALACFVATIIAGLVFLFLTSQPNILGSLRDTLISAMYNAVLAALVYVPVEKLSGVKTRQ